MLVFFNIIASVKLAKILGKGFSFQIYAFERLGIFPIFVYFFLNLH
jgi:hypothetical protein